MNKPWRVDVLQCRGSSYDVGKQMAEGFLETTTRGATFHRRKGQQPFGFVLKDAQAALCTYAPNIWENCTDWRTASRFHWSGPLPNTQMPALAFRSADAPRS